MGSRGLGGLRFAGYVTRAPDLSNLNVAERDALILSLLKVVGRLERALARDAELLKWLFFTKIAGLHVIPDPTNNDPSNSRSSGGWGHWSKAPFRDESRRKSLQRI